jgi:hypothetical protein
MSSALADPPVRAEARKPRRRWARGADRPEYMRADDGDIDRVMVMMVALMAEVSALRDRLDTHEAVAELGGAITTAAIEAYELTPERQAAREANRQAMLKRVLRAITEEREAALDQSNKAGRVDHP